MLPLVGLLIFSAVALAAWEVWRPKERAIAQRILPVTAGEFTSAARLEGSAVVRFLGPTARRAGRTIGGLLPQNFLRRTDHMLQMANEPWSLTGFLSVWAIVAVGGTVLFAWIVLNRDISTLQVSVLAVGLLPFPLALPYAVLRRRVKNRQTRITRSLPDAMDLLVTCVEAGMGVDAAFGLVTERTEGPVSEAFAMYLRQVGLGRSRREALDYVASRTGVPDLIGLAASIIQGEELGTTLGDVLRRCSEELRASRAQRAREAAQRAPVLMTIPLVICFLPAMGAIIVVPAVLNLLDFATNLGAR